MRVDYAADGVGLRGKNLSMLHEPRFKSAWDFSFERNREGWAKQGTPPDIRLRASVCCWAARHALTLDGDFVECGVHTGLLSLTVCHYLDFGKLSRCFYLYDTWKGIPLEDLKDSERLKASQFNQDVYFDCYELAKKNFLPFSNVKLIRGTLPDTLDETCPEKIAYLSIDLNSATYEEVTIKKLWAHIVPGGPIVIDDYAFRGHEEQYDMWNRLAEGNGIAILTIPTGQGLLLHP